MRVDVISNFNENNVKIAVFVQQWISQRPSWLKLKFTKFQNALLLNFCRKWWHIIFWRHLIKLPHSSTRSLVSFPFLQQVKRKCSPCRSYVKDYSLIAIYSHIAACTMLWHIGGLRTTNWLDSIRWHLFKKSRIKWRSTRLMRLLAIRKYFPQEDNWPLERIMQRALILHAWLTQVLIFELSKGIRNNATKFCIKNI